ncbi:MAG TPA: S8 family peptidase [Pseudoduganella sp.]
MKLRPVTWSVLCALALAAHAAHADGTRRPYIVQLADAPAASYSGGVNGMIATRPAPGQRLNPQSQPVQLYTDYLRQRQASVKSLVSSAPVLHEYTVVLNGFSAMLTDDEVRQLKASGTVADITADEPRQLQTSFTPTFLGLDKPGGLWSQLGGVEKAGEGIVVGIIDSGVWPENPGYADRVDASGNPTFAGDGKLAYDAPPSTWHGTCQAGEGFTVGHCNNKLIGARYFDETFRAYLDESGSTASWSDFRSPRDSLGANTGAGGHGSHTSTTAAGNHGVVANVGGAYVGSVSGMAPRARVAAYKVCWSFLGPNSPPQGTISCWTGDSVSAIEQAVIDGVNVLNYSIGGSGSLSDPVDRAFLHAANAGVFVAASAGNAGPANTVSHNSPWLTTVAASTHNRFQKADVTLGNKAVYGGASLNMTLLPAGTPIVRAQDAGLAGADPGRLQYCYSATSNGGKAVLDPAKVKGKIVTCLRGENARVDKSLAVQDAGGAGMVLIDNGLGLVSEAHSVPTVHVSQEDGAAIAAYAQTANASASIGKFVNTTMGKAPVMANFSSRGPNPFDGNILKPDLTAPGVSIIAGFTPGLSQGQHSDIVNGTLTPPPAWGLLSGTSMSSPHVAGVAALVKHRHPDWSPSWIKSALMTTGYDTLPDGLVGMDAGTLPFAQGAGHIDPTAAADPGLVYGVTATDYKKYLCGAGALDQCSEGSIKGYNLNLPSISVGNVIDTTVVTRQVTNVGGAPATYTGKIDVHGFNAVLQPAVLTLAPGETKSFNVLLTRTSAYENVWQLGSMEWTDGTHKVRSPVVARTGRLVTAPGSVRSEEQTGSTMMLIQTAFSGRMGAAVGGLKEVQRTSLRVGQAPENSSGTTAQVLASCRAGGAGVLLRPVSIPADTVAASFELFDRDTGVPGVDDLDLALLDSSGKLVSVSTVEGSNEQVLLSSPPAGEYKLCVIGYSAANKASIDFQLSSAIVTKADQGGALKAMVPGRVYKDRLATVNVNWTGLAKGKRFLGGVQWLDLEGKPASTTLVQVETDDPVPLARPERQAAAVDPRL